MYIIVLGDKGRENKRYADHTKNTKDKFIMVNFHYQDNREYEFRIFTRVKPASFSHSKIISLSAKLMAWASPKG